MPVTFSSNAKKEDGPCRFTQYLHRRGLNELDRLGLLEESEAKRTECWSKPSALCVNIVETPPL